MGPSDLSSLVESCRLGDRSAFAELYQACAPSVLHVAQRVLRDEAEAHDVMQETFLTAFRRLETYRGEGSVRAWLVQIAVRIAVRARRRSLGVAALESDGVPEPAAPVQEPRDRDFEQAVSRAVDELPERSRLVFVLHVSESWTHGEIAEALGIDEGTSKSQLSYARKLLRTKLSRFAHGP